MRALGETGRRGMVGRVKVRARAQGVGVGGEGGGKGSEGVDEKPKSVYEVVTRQMLVGLQEDLAEVKGRVNTLLWVVLGATVVEFVMRLVR